MPLKPGKLKSASVPARGVEREIREALVEDAHKTEGEGRDLVNGEGGTLGLGDGEDLNKDD